MTNRHPLRNFLTLALGVGLSAAAGAQEAPRPEPPPDASSAPARKRPWNEFDASWISVRLKFEAFEDGAFYSQDAASKQQVGDLSPTALFRVDDLSLFGQIKFSHPWSFVAGGNYKGLDPTSARGWTLTNLNLSIPLGPFGAVTLGKQKEGDGLEMMETGRDVPFMERSVMTTATTFVESHVVGVRLSNSVAAGRMTWSAGWFNNWLDDGQTFSRSGNIFAGRVTGLPFEAKGVGRLLHLGLSAVYRQSQNGSFKLKSVPEVYEAPDFVDTGSFPASHGHVREDQPRVPLFLQAWRFRRLGAGRPLLERRPHERHGPRGTVRPDQRCALVVSDKPVASGVRLRLRPPRPVRAPGPNQLLPAPPAVRALNSYSPGPAFRERPDRTRKAHRGTMTRMPAIAPLADRIPPRGTTNADEILGLFLEWVSASGLTLYPAQEEAILEIMAGKHVILATPTGSGKSLVALGLHFKAVCEGRVSFYTSPIKALASEKFFSLCTEFGPENVGMLTGDASINAEAGVVCCTAEVLSNMALRLGEDLEAPYVVMDEFHYYGDKERGVAWQVPLLVLPRTQFLLMSATLGETSAIAERLKAFTGREVAYVSSEDRPVPLDYEYREMPLHETIEDLLAQRKSPVYVVNFTQRECAELAQSLTSAKIGSREEREEIRRIVGARRLTTPYGKEFRRFLSFGIGVHHAGLLPKYRLLVEQLAQKGLLHVICGTDTLGVGVNIPIRTVLFTKLAKFDGTKVGLLSVREFKQISGRAGRRGFDDRGSVVVQAPEHIIDKKQAEKKADALGKKTSRTFKGPAKGEVSWTVETFQKLIARPPETLKSQFRLTHGMVLDLLQRDADMVGGSRNFSSLRVLIARCHEDDGAKPRLVKRAALLVRSLYRAGIIGLASETPCRVVVAKDLQGDFSLHQALSLFALSVLAELDAASPTYAVDAISVVESILEDPDVILRRQVDRAKGKLVAELKAEGVPYEERMARLEEVTHPKPLADFLYGAFNEFRVEHPWTAGSDVSPKSIGREMFETFSGFSDYVKSYGLERSEGVLLRYLSQLYKTLDQTIPEAAKTDELWDALGYFRSLVGETDSSLLEEWEGLRHPELLLKEARQPEARKEAAWLTELLSNPRVFAARVRAEMHLLVRALAGRDWEEAAERVYQSPETDEAAREAEVRWDAARFESAMAPFFEEYGELVSGAEARLHHWTNLRSTGPRWWEVTQTLLDPEGDHTWAIFAGIDLRDATAVDGPILRIERIGE